LPHGDDPAALESAHFPDRIHEFVWRNWNVVGPAKLAQVLNTSVENVMNLAASMGLPRDVAIPPEMRSRGYISLIKRNWHLLPYEQLLELLDMTPEQLDFTLREDDMLWYKVGKLKPTCEPLRWQPPSEAALQRAVEIRQIVEKEFGEEILRPGEPRFDFVRQLSRPLDSSSPSESVQDAPVSLRFVYSYLAVYGDPLLNAELDPYPDGFLQRLSAVGVNGIWMHAVLRDLAPGGNAFPEFGAGHEERLANLRALVARAKKYGIVVYLYMNEPRGMPADFFASRPDMAGVKDDQLTAMCTSNPAVRKWMSDAFAHLFHEVPDLGGVFAITASENLTNCACRGQQAECPRCKHRTDSEIIAEVVATIEEGVHRGNPDADVIIYDWGWGGWGDGTAIVERLPKSVSLMSLSEWDVPIERGGIKATINEYSISAVGPGPRALQHWKVAKQLGIKTAAEIQFNNTCELGSLPYLPVLDLVAEHLQNLAPAKLSSMLIGWTMGGYPSPNFQLAQRLNQPNAPDADQALDALAQERFGPAGAPHARKAWTLLSDAYREYPFHIDVVYSSPVQLGPANPLFDKTSGYKATMWGMPYDDLDGWRGPYPREVFASQFQKMADGWKPGLAELQLAVENAPPERREEVCADLRYAQAAAIHFQSVANQANFIIARDALADPASKLSQDERQKLRDQMRKALESEIDLARQLYALTKEDSTIGFEPATQYFYLPLDLVEKVVNCRWILSQLK
jgi:hypothetical protein